MPQTSAKDLNQIGKILKSNGSDGDVLVDFASIEMQDLDLTEPVYVVFDGVPVPFFFSSFAEKGASRAVAHFVDVDSAKDAEEMAGRAVLSASFSFDGDADETGLATLVGWRLLDGKSEEVGVVSGYEDIPGNPCICVQTTRRDQVMQPDGTPNVADVQPSHEEVLVPFHPDLVLSIDEKSKVLVMEIPDGLLG